MRLRGRPIVVLAMVWVALGLSTGGGGGCTSTTLTVGAVPAAVRTGRVTLEARLTADGEPLQGAGVSFFVTGTGPNDWTGQSVGGADSDADGTARVTLDAGLEAQVPAGYQVDGYRAEFRGTSSVDDEGDYCRSNGEARISG